MIEWLRNKLHNFIFPSNRDGSISSKMASVRETHDADIEGMRFTVMPAEGGTIVQMRTYDRRKDESNTKTYVIPEAEQDIAHRIGQIVAMELIRL
jgi:hypothetical protein